MIRGETYLFDGEDETCELVEANNTGLLFEFESKIRGFNWNVEFNKESKDSTVESSYQFSNDNVS